MLPWHPLTWGLAVCHGRRRQRWLKGRRACCLMQLCCCRVFEPFLGFGFYSMTATTTMHCNSQMMKVYDVVESAMRPIKLPGM